VRGVQGPLSTHEHGNGPFTERFAKHRAGWAICGSRERLPRHLFFAVSGEPVELHLLGLLRSTRAQLAKAFPGCSRLSRADSEYVEAGANLGIAYYEERIWCAPRECCAKAIELSPKFAKAGRTADAASESRPGRGAHALGERWSQSPADAQRRAVVRGRGLLPPRRLPQALEFYEQLARELPDDPIPAAMLASVRWVGWPPRHRSLRPLTFDDFAEAFERSRQGCNSGAPILIAAVNGSGTLRRTEFARVLDIGAEPAGLGTAASAAARRLSGVDLRRSCCPGGRPRPRANQLNCAELTRGSRVKRAFDLAIARTCCAIFGDLQSHSHACKGRDTWRRSPCSGSSPRKRIEQPFSNSPHGGLNPTAYMSASWQKARIHRCRYRKRISALEGRRCRRW